MIICQPVSIYIYICIWLDKLSDSHRKWILFNYSTGCGHRNDKNTSENETSHNEVCTLRVIMNAGVLDVEEYVSDSDCSDIVPIQRQVCFFIQFLCFVVFSWRAEIFEAKISDFRSLACHHCKFKATLPHSVVCDFNSDDLKYG